ncbi:MAG: cytochrome c [Gammaproteobacteria bacterium]
MRGGLTRCARGLAAGLLTLAAGGCEKAMQDMYEQPRYDPLEPSTLFANGASARVPVGGTLPLRRGALAESSGGRRGTPVRVPETVPPVLPLLGASAGSSGSESPYGLSGPGDIPLPLTRQTYRRGRERYDIYCAPCHSVLGDGDGMVVRRGFPAPPSYHSARLRRASDQHFYAVISHGYGAMYSYADRLSESDRWAVVAYIRALQLSQHAPLQALDATDRQRLGAAGEKHD